MIILLLIIVLIIIFSFIIYSEYVIYIKKNKIMEYMTSYQPYIQPNEVQPTEGQNANNIMFLKDQLDLLTTEYTDLSGNIITLQDQLNSISSQQEQAMSQLTPDGQPLPTSTDDSFPTLSTPTF
jgi:TolA-binding protein